jgi:predicted O-methyltransferase YrrM
MTDPRWTEVDDYVERQLLPHDDTLAAALAASRDAGLPALQVSSVQGKLLNLLARAQRARMILEVGSLGGYSTTWLARALPPGGRMVTLELDPRHAQVATANLARAGLDDVVEVRVAPAATSLAALAAEGAGPFDLVFIDADKESNAQYFGWAVRLARPGTLIIVDNVVRQGALLDADSPDADVQGTRRLFEAVAAEPRVDATAVQTVGVKGHDGWLVAVVGD